MLQSEFNDPVKEEKTAPGGTRRGKGKGVPGRGKGGRDGHGWIWEDPGMVKKERADPV